MSSSLQTCRRSRGTASRTRSSASGAANPNPIGVENDLLSNTDITSGDACAALQSEIVLEPGQEIEFVVLMGVCRLRGYRERIPLRAIDQRSIARPQAAQSSPRRGQGSSGTIISPPVHVETPDREMNLMLNVWGKRQSVGDVQYEPQRRLLPRRACCSASASAISLRI